MTQEVAVSETSVIEKLMVQGVSPENLKSFMDMNERILDRNAKSEYAADFVKMKPHLPKVIRKKTNSQTNSKYAPLEDINQTIDPILSEYGFATSTSIMEQTEKSVTVKAELWHRGGHVEHTCVKMPLDDSGIAGKINKTAPHATSSSIMYARRTGVCALLNISTGDDKDGNLPKRNEVQNITEEQEMKLQEYIAATNTDENKFLLAYKVNALHEMDLKQYEHAIGVLKKKESKNV